MHCLPHKPCPAESVFLLINPLTIGGGAGVCEEPSYSMELAFGGYQSTSSPLTPPTNHLRSCRRSSARSAFSRLPGVFQPLLLCGIMTTKLLSGPGLTSRRTSLKTLIDPAHENCGLRLHARTQRPTDNFTSYIEDVTDLCRRVNSTMSDALKIRRNL